MVTTGNNIAPAPADVPVARTPPASVKEFQAHARAIASNVLRNWVGEDRANEAISRISVAMAASVACSRDPKDFYECTVTSVAACVALSALTGIMPGTGSTALAYVIPQRARRGEAPQLQYNLSHRGINALARRCGQTMLATPISMTDEIKACPDGQVEVVFIDLDKPPQTWDELRGVFLAVKELGTGVIVHRGWVPKVLIERRRRMSRSFTGNHPEYSPWTNWPVEMAIKTAMHYSIGRGWIVIDDTQATRALSEDSRVDTVDVTPVLIDRTESVKKKLEGAAAPAPDDPSAGPDSVGPASAPESGDNVDADDETSVAGSIVPQAEEDLAELSDRIERNQGDQSELARILNDAQKYGHGKVWESLVFEKLKAAGYNPSATTRKKRGDF